MYQFPYEFVSRGSSIVIYGAGAVGKSFVSQIIDTKYCNIVAILDQKVSGSNILGMPVYDVLQIKNFNYDFLVIAIDSLAVSMEIRTHLLLLEVKEEKMIFAAMGLLESKLKKVMTTNKRLFLDNIGSRLDKRLARLEILQYFSIPETYNRLDADGIETLKEIQDYCDLGERVFPEDPYYEETGTTVPEQYTMENIFLNDKGYYCTINETKLYLGFDKLSAEALLKGYWFHYERNNPHTYLSPEEDGIDVPDCAVVADVGAAEGYFGIKYLKRSKKVYFFESELEWIVELNKSLVEEDKAEVVRGTVGDRDEHLKLDDFFLTRPKPDVVKIDVEGAECSVLRGMKKLLDSDDPLVLLVATYHRQEDWERIDRILNPPDKPPRFQITHSKGYYWHLPDPKPPYFRRGIMRAKKITINETRERACGF